MAPVVLHVRGLRGRRVVIARALGFGNGFLHVLRHVFDQAIRFGKPGCDIDRRSIDDHGADPCIVLAGAHHREHAAPGIAEQVEIVEPERIAHRIELVDPQIVAVEVVVLVRDVRLAAPDLVVEDDLTAVEVGHVAVVQQIEMRIARTSVEDEQRLLPRPAFAVDLVVRLEAPIIDVTAAHFRHGALLRHAAARCREFPETASSAADENRP